MYCRYCTLKIDDPMTNCPRCGEDLSPDNQPQDPALYLTGAIVCTIFSSVLIALCIFKEPNQPYGQIRVLIPAVGVLYWAFKWFKKFNDRPRSTTA